MAASQQLNYQAQADLLSATALQTAATVPASLVEYTLGAAEAVAVAEAAADQLATAEAAVVQQEQLEYKVNLYATLNQGAEANAYIGELLAAEDARLDKNTKDVRRIQYSLRSQLMLYDYLRGYYRMATRFTQLTLLVSLLLLGMAALWRAGRLPAWALALVLLLLGLLYLAAAVMVASRVARRNPTTGWSIMRWANPAGLTDQADGGQCTGGSWDTAASDPPPPVPCSDGATAYLSNYSILPTSLPATGTDGGPIDPSIQAWWHWYTVGQPSGMVFPGVGCYESVTCADATRMYRQRYLPAGQTSFPGNMTAWQHYNANRDTNFWPGPALGCK